jgi:hypothetical protein
MTQELLIRKLVDGVVMPPSVSNVIHYYLLSGASKEEILEVLDREKVLFFLRYLLEKHLGKVLSIEATLSVEKDRIVIGIRRIHTETSIYTVSGTFTINPITSTANLELEIRDVSYSPVKPKKLIEDGMYRVKGGVIEIRYYV